MALLYGVGGNVSPSGKGNLPVLPSSSWGYYLGLLGAVSAVSVVLLIGSMRVFRRQEGDFAEEL